MSKSKILLILALIIAAIFLVVPLFSSSDKPEEYSLTITSQHCDVQVLDSKRKSVDILYEGETYTIRVTPETGYEVTGIYLNGNKVVMTQIKPTRDVLLRVDTAVKTYELSFGAGPVHVYDSKGYEVTTVTHFEEYKITAPCDGYYYYNIWITYDGFVDVIESDICYWTCDGDVQISGVIRDYVKTTLSFAFPENGDYIYYTNRNANYVQEFSSGDWSSWGFTLPENYRFVGWAIEPDSTEVVYAPHTNFEIPIEANPYVLYAVIEPIIYTLNYWSMDGSTLLHSVSNHGPTELTLVDYEDYATINEGYYFRGWNFEPLVEYSTSLEPGENFVLDRNYDLYASVPQINYTLTYYQQVEDFEPSTYTESHLYFEEFSLRPISEFQQVTNGDFYNFLGWDTDPSADNVVYLDNQKVSKLTNYPAEVVLYAVWEPIIVTLNLYAPDETTLLYTSDFAGLQQTTTLPAYSTLVDVEVGKYFLNWRQLNGSNYYQDCASVAMTNDISLTAVLQDVTYRVSLNTTTIYDDGVNDPIISATEYSLPTCTYGQTYTLPLASTLAYFAKDGYNLIGWDIDSSADTVVYADGASFSNLTTTHNSVISLYAVYEAALPSHSKTFSENTPEQVSAVSAYIAENNLTSQQVYDTFGWSLGDAISVGEVNAYIIGFNHDDKTDGSGKAGITLFSTSVDGGGAFSMSSSTSCSAYTSSDMYSRLNSYFTNQLTSSWQAVVSEVSKYGSVVNSGSLAPALFNCNLFPLSKIELTGFGYEVSSERPGENQYEIFASNSYDSVLTTSTFWLRDCNATKSWAYYAGSDLTTSVATATSKHCVRFAFCV